MAEKSFIVDVKEKTARSNWRSPDRAWQQSRQGQRQRLERRLGVRGNSKRERRERGPGATNGGPREKPKGQRDPRQHSM